ncbi:hypothetical protein SAMN05421747_10491 [Parapedobacter composti]|uniref:HTH cro/C1-type domain-containing protein n=1 Tax=Parapedobacter composti TaxID=623281 RepID=A0A1I1GBP8_9SPHI|nr:hypothetical protein [Parapedobacter composti]SFC08991.1 hypothetical protein SAMN05421747_10491 [Parapedobacter composti]
MSTPLKRIKHFIDLKGITVSAFEKSVGFSNGSFSGQLKRNRTIGVDKLEHILKTYPDLNAEWVLTGRGHMLRDAEKESDTPPPAFQEAITVMERNYERTIESLNQVIAAQQKTIAVLEQLVARKGE